MTEWAHRVDSSRVVSETVGGEVLAIDNVTGTYFNLEGAAVPMWEALVYGTTRSAVTTAVAEQHGID